MFNEDVLSCFLLMGLWGWGNRLLGGERSQGKNGYIHDPEAGIVEARGDADSFPNVYLSQNGNWPFSPSRIKGSSNLPDCYR